MNFKKYRVNPELDGDSHLKFRTGMELFLGILFLLLDNAAIISGTLLVGR
jgi:hypothetical protein